MSIPSHAGCGESTPGEPVRTAGERRTSIYSPAPLDEDPQQAALPQGAAHLSEGEERHEGDGHDDAERDDALHLATREFREARGNRLAGKNTNNDAFENVEGDE